MMKKQVTWFVLFLIMLLSLSNVNAQFHLDFGKQTERVMPGSNGRSFYHFKGGQNAEILEHGYFTAYNYDNSIIGLDRSDMHMVSSSPLDFGFYLAQYSAHGKYNKHTYVQSSRDNVVYDLAVDSSFFYIFMSIKDSIKVANNPTHITNKMEYAILKFKKDLSFVKATYFEYDTLTSWQLTVAPNKLVLYGYYNSEVDLDIQGNNIQLDKPKVQYPYNNYDHLLLSFDADLNYENYGVIKSQRNTKIFDVYISSNNDVSISMYTDQFADLVYGLDTIQKDSNLNFGINPAILWLDKDLKLKRYWAERDVKIKNITYASFNENGNVAIGYYMENTVNTAYYKIELRSRNGVLLNKINTELFFTSSGKGVIVSSPMSIEDCFALNSKNLTWNFPDTSIVADNLTRILLSADSFKIKEVIRFGNEHISSISFQGMDYIMGTLKYGYQVELDTLNGKLPSYKLGTKLDFENSYYGLYKYTRQCIPVTAWVIQDSISDCADEYGSYGPSYGNMRVEYEGTGASFQWYRSPDFEIPLEDMESPLQGGIRRIGTQTNFLTRISGSTIYSSTKFVVKVNGACTEPFFADTINYEVWGTPKLRLYNNSLKAEVGDTVVIQTYLNDPDYPMDSLTFQWYKGKEALIEGAKYVNTNTKDLTINNVSLLDASTYSCKVNRVHCKDINTQKDLETYLAVQNINGLTDLVRANITLFPNPAKNQVTLRLEKPYTGWVKLTNALGQKFEIYSNVNSINTERLPSGIYLLSFESQNTLFTSKLIIEE